MKLGVSSDIPKIRPLPKHKKRDKKGWRVYFNWAVLRKHDQRDKKKVEEKIKMT